MFLDTFLHIWGQSIGFQVGGHIDAFAGIFLREVENVHGTGTARGVGLIFLAQNMRNRYLGILAKN